MMTSSPNLARRHARDKSLKNPGLAYIVWSILLDGNRLKGREFFVEQEGSLQDKSWIRLYKYRDGQLIHC